jgi:thioredoxin 1
MNTDDNQNTAIEYNIMSIPTLMLFQNGQVAKKVIGAYPKRAIEAEFELTAA